MSDHQRWLPAHSSAGSHRISIAAVLAASVLFVVGVALLFWYNTPPSAPQSTQSVAARPVAPAFDTTKAFADFAAGQQRPLVLPDRQSGDQRALQQLVDTVAQECGYISKNSKIHPHVCDK